MPECGTLPKAPQQIITFEEIAKIVTLAVSVGINKIKITGGEPLVRKDLPRLFQLLFSVSGLIDVSLTTNGMLLQKYAGELKDAGLKRLNISIDSLDSRMFKRITRFGNLEDVLKGIDAALRENFLIKLNVVIMRGLNDDEILGFVEFARKRKIIVRFIELMPMAGDNSLSEDFYVSCDEIKERLGLLGNLKAVVSECPGSGPAQYSAIDGFSSLIGFISPISRTFCASCNRLRLTSDGLLMPCLSSPCCLDLKTPLRQDKEEEARDLLKKAVSLKPSGHNLSFFPQRHCLMSQIGG